MSIAEVQLGRVEGLRMLRNPAVWIALIPTVMWVRSVLGTSDANEDRYLILVGFSLLIPGFVMVIHTMLAVLRDRLSSTDELLAVMPVGPDRRSIAHGVSALSGLVVALVATIAVYAALRPGRTIGRGFEYLQSDTAIPRPNVAQLLQGPMALVAMTAFVVALVRWIPSWLVLLPFAFLLLVQGVFFGIFFGVPTSSTTFLLPLASGVVHGEWIGCGETDDLCSLPVSGFDRVTPWWHLAYLVAIAACCVVAAVLRHRRDRTTWFAFAAALAAVVALAIAQVVVSVEYVAVVAP